MSTYKAYVFCLHAKIIQKTDLFEICDSIVESGRLYAKKFNTPSPLMFAYHGIEYLGSGHGLAGILQVLLCFPEYLKENPEAERDVKNSVDFFLQIQNHNKNFPIEMDQNHTDIKVESKDLVHWCHGGKNW